MRDSFLELVLQEHRRDSGWLSASIAIEMQWFGSLLCQRSFLAQVLFENLQEPFQRHSQLISYFRLDGPDVQAMRLQVQMHESQFALGLPDDGPDHGPAQPTERLLSCPAQCARQFLGVTSMQDPFFEDRLKAKAPCTASEGFSGSLVPVSWLSISPALLLMVPSSVHPGAG